MTCKISYILLICKSTIFICLAVIFVIFYFMDIVQKFAERDTTLVFSQETILENEMKPPFITFCMTPHAKRSILKGYNLSYGVLNEPNPNDRKILVGLNKTVKDLFKEVTFQINVDFEVTIILWFYEEGHGWKAYEGKIKEGNDNYIKVCNEPKKEQ